MDWIVRMLFPRHLAGVDDNNVEDVEKHPLFTIKEFEDAVFAMKH